MLNVLLIICQNRKNIVFFNIKIGQKVYFQKGQMTTLSSTLLPRERETDIVKKTSFSVRLDWLSDGIIFERTKILFFLSKSSNNSLMEHSHYQDKGSSINDVTLFLTITDIPFHPLSRFLALLL